MHRTVICGVGMTRFGRHADRNFKSLVREAATEALSDAGVQPGHVGVVYYSNALGGLLQGQGMSGGQHALHNTSLAGIPLINVENACASGSTALNQAWLAVASGQVDVAVAIGAERLGSADKSSVFEAALSGLDQDRLEELLGELGPSGSGSRMMDMYARWARWYMERSGASITDFALVAVKNHEHGLANPKAPFGARMTVEEVLSARLISEPLTRPMCGPLVDGAAAIVVTTPEVAKSLGSDAVEVLASVLAGAQAGTYGEVVPKAAALAYEFAGVSPEDIDLVECHDATAPAELIVMEELGLCKPGEAPILVRAGDTRVGGRLPVNPSGGLIAKGHPAGATGLAQVVELVDQLRGRAGGRQVANSRLALAENGGGYLGPDIAVATVTILGRN